LAPPPGSIGFVYLRTVNGGGNFGGALSFADSGTGGVISELYSIANGGFWMQLDGTPYYKYSSANFQVLPTTASTSTTTGALTVAGGVGITGALYAGGAIVAVSGVNGGSAAGTSLTVRSNSNAAPSGDTLNLYGSTVTIGNGAPTGGIINLTGGSGGGITVNIASVNNGLGALNVYNTAGSKQQWVPGGGNTIITFPTATDTLVGKATTDTLTNKTLASPTLTGTVTFGAGATVAGDVAFSSTTASTSPTTGALTVAGGVGVAGALSVGSILRITVPSGHAIGAASPGLGWGLYHTGTISATGGFAINWQTDAALTATANGDTLQGMRITAAPIKGAFTGVASHGLYIVGGSGTPYDFGIIVGDTSPVYFGGALTVAGQAAFIVSPTAPTPTLGDNTTKLATTAFVLANAGVTGVVRTVNKQVFTASGTYTPSAGMLYCIIESVGSGGGGGGTFGVGSSVFAGGGGGAGSYSRLIASAATIGASQTVTVGAAGIGGVLGVGPGTAGADVSVGTLCIGKGGSGGTNSTAGAFGARGAGGVAGTGDFSTPGGAGSVGVTAGGFATIFFCGGDGGDSFFGAGGRQSVPVSAASAVGAAGSNYGAGGSGAVSHNTTSSAAGGAGSKGIVFITEFCG
jgi:hypothetical protein